MIPIFNLLIVIQYVDTYLLLMRRIRFQIPLAIFLQFAKRTQLFISQSILQQIQCPIRFG